MGIRVGDGKSRNKMMMVWWSDMGQKLAVGGWGDGGLVFIFMESWACVLFHFYF